MRPSGRVFEIKSPTVGDPYVSRHSEFFCPWRQNRTRDPERGATRVQKGFTGVEEASVAHSVPDSLRRPDDLRIAAGSFENAVDPRVEDRDDLSQSGENSDLSNTREKLAENEVQAAPNLNAIREAGLGARKREGPSALLTAATLGYDQRGC